MRKSLLALPAALLCAPAPCQEQGTVGGLGHWQNIRVSGAESFSPSSIARELAMLPDHPAVAHPTAPLAPFLTWVEERITVGYQHLGFPRVTVDARPQNRAREPEAREEVAEAARPSGRGAGFRNARTELEVRIEEGPRFRAGEVVVEGAEHVAAEAIARALDAPIEGRGRDADGLPIRSPAFWPRGEPADLRPERFVMAWRGVQRVYEATGRLGAAGRVDAVYREDGTADLRVRVESEGTAARIGPPQWSGDFRDDPQAIAARVDLHAGEPCTTGRLEEIRRAIEGLARYRRVAVRAGDPDADGRAPLLIELEQVASARAFEDMPWEDLAVLRRSLAWLEERLRGGAVLRGVIHPDPAREGRSRVDRLELWVSRDGVLVLFHGVTVEGLPLGDVVAACEGGKVLLGCEAVGRYAIVPVEPPALPLVLQAWPTADGKSEFRWGIGVSTGATTHEPGLLVVAVHPAVLMRAFDGTSVESSSERLRIRSAEGDAFHLEVERDSAATSLSLRHERSLLEFDREPLAVQWGRAVEFLRDKGCKEVKAAELGSAFLDHLSDHVAGLDLGSGPALPQLVLAAWRAGLAALRTGALGPLVREAEPGPAFDIPPQPGHGEAGTDELTRLLLLLRRTLMEQVEYESWAFNLVRDLSVLAVSRSREAWAAVAKETDRQVRADRLGPLACASAAWSYGRMGLDEMAAYFAGIGRDKLDYERFWRDLLALAPEGSVGRSMLGAIGAAWRELHARRATLARERGWSAETLQALHETFARCGSEEPLAWAEAGFRRLYEARLRDALRDWLAGIAR